MNFNSCVSLTFSFNLFILTCAKEIENILYCNMYFVILHMQSRKLDIVLIMEIYYCEIDGFDVTSTIRKHIPGFSKVKIDEVELFDLYLAVSFHSISSPSLTSSSISEKSGCDSCASSPTSSPSINCTLWAGGVTKQLCNRT